MFDYEVELSFLRGILRNYRHDLGQSSFGKLCIDVGDFGKRNKIIDNTKEISALINSGKVKISQKTRDAIILFLKHHRNSLSIKNKFEENYLDSILYGKIRDDKSGGEDLRQSEFISEITTGGRIDEHGLRTGIYQFFRRHKPIPISSRYEGGLDYSNQLNHTIVIELLYVDVKNKCAEMVTCEGNIYRGNIYVSRQDVVYIYLIRKLGSGYVFRVITFEEMQSNELGFGILLKTGNTTSRPIASECLIRWVDPAVHDHLFAEIQNISAEAKNQIENNPIIREYLYGLDIRHKGNTNGILENECLKVADIPLLRYLVEGDNPSSGNDLSDATVSVAGSTNGVLFREPLRVRPERSCWIA